MQEKDTVISTYKQPCCALWFLFFQCTCIDVSKRWLALGSSGGGLNLIQKDGWKQRLFLAHKVRVKNSIEKFLRKMELGKRHCYKLIFY